MSTEATDDEIKLFYQIQCQQDWPSTLEELGVEIIDLVLLLPIEKLRNTAQRSEWWGLADWVEAFRTSPDGGKSFLE